ncbi:pyruvate decarboxylase [Pleurostoma richardsiae]|uniref:Pyruvate decarboxylase n=1 Tax=Pleurostoma richardsiae TaxID=41990 RepID=A0AA38R8P3_9PEZI|nr:pyruvate decarboxylase [Pleurostoma richardsiae]
MGELLVGEYLLKRIQELGVKSIFGVPGDYELAFLDLILQAGIDWKGTPNELVGAYAADGYARINGVGVLVTTFGPGETSALCGIAGAYTEFVPVIHIVGYPSVKAQREHAILHHTLGEGKFNNYHEMSKQISCATTVLEDTATAASEIDRVLNALLLHGQPVYIGIPTDITFEKTRDTGLLVPLSKMLDPNNQGLESKILGDIGSRLENAKSPVIVVDGGATRHGVLSEVSDLITVTGFPVFTTPMGKGTVDEKCAQYGGTYVGVGSRDDVKDVVESSDLVLWIGMYPSDMNTGEFTVRVSKGDIVNFERFYTMIGGQKYPLKMKHLLRKLVDSLKSESVLPRQTKLACVPYGQEPEKPDGVITQSWLWPRLGKFLLEDDLVVVETGTAQSGFNASPLPSHITTWTQEIFGSIGYATGAMVGATVAFKEKGGRRSILITGDGSLQLTAQAIADLLRHGTNPIIFVLNNDGYTVERLIHGVEAPYNSIPPWKYTGLLDVFGPQTKSESYLVRSANELDSLLDNPSFGEPTCTKLVEIVLDKLDAPEATRKIGKAIEQFNKSA